MKAKLLLILTICCSLLFANGVGIVNPQSGTTIKLLKSQVEVSVEDQVAITKTTQTFVNNVINLNEISYAFPVPNEASATKLRYCVDGIWHTANMGVNSSGGSGAPSNMNQNLVNYLGATPLFYLVESTLPKDSTLIVELTYVELLPYKNGIVKYFCPNKYTQIQTSPIIHQSLNFSLISQRTILSINSIGCPGAQMTVSDHNASLLYNLYESPALNNYEISYSLAIDELGLFSLSSYMPANEVPDQFGRGFFMFLAEPAPSQAVVNKVFTVIIDKSGSMAGDKIYQAKEAAKYIVNNLNEGDKFNIIDFEAEVYSFKPSHVYINEATKAEALSYISNIYDMGGTNISGAFSTAIPQFASSTNNTANIVVFLTDGEATYGITNTQGILSHVNSLTSQISSTISINTFGIGSSTNQQLLTLLASEHFGLSTFLSNNDLYSTITEFYNKIRNPVLINPQLSITPPNVISEIYPAPLPNLYKGEQLIVVGRYNEPAAISVEFSGTAFGNAVNYNYTPQISDSSITRYQFLAKIWAKKKIEHLLIQYNGLNPNSSEAEVLKQQIISISLAYGVICKFTNFSGGTEIDDELTAVNKPKVLELSGNYPNPFNPITTIKFNVNSSLFGDVKIKIFNSTGQLVRVMSLRINGAGVYSFVWDGKDSFGDIAHSGMYFYQIDFDCKYQVTGKMLLLK